MNIAEQYENGLLQGWAGEELAKSEWDMLKGSDSFVKFPTSSFIGDKKKTMLYKFVRQVLGKDTVNYPQLVGSCVAFGAKNATEYVSCVEIALNGDLEKYKPLFTPYLYGIGRVFIGRGQLNGSDGSLGSWMADAIVKYGVISSDEDGLPAYSAQVERQWGNTPGPPQKYVEIGKKHLIRSAAQIKSWEELCAAIHSGFACTIASSQGFSMKAGSDGFHAPSGRWEHQMCIIGVDELNPQEYGIILNSWGDVHGQLKDFENGENLPIGCIRAKRNVIESMIRSGECFAYSNFQGFEDRSREIQKQLFKMI